MNSITVSHFTGSADFFAMRNMLLEGYSLEQRPCNMFFYYLDNWRFARDDDESYFEQNALIWRMDGKVIAFNILQNLPLYSLQVHPHYYRAVPLILDNLVQRGVKQIGVYEHQQDIINHLLDHGFAGPKHVGIENEYDLTGCAQAIDLPEGFAIKTAAGLTDLRTVYRAKGSVFHGPHMTEESCAFRMASRPLSPSYSNDSAFLVVDTKTNECVSFALAWLDKGTGVVGFEPIGTVPDYRGRGLSKALLTHVFAKYHREGYKRVSIRTGRNYEAPANYLYRSLKPTKIYNVVEYSAK